MILWIKKCSISFIGIDVQQITFLTNIKTYIPYLNSNPVGYSMHTYILYFDFSIELRG